MYGLPKKTDRPETCSQSPGNFSVGRPKRKGVGINHVYFSGPHFSTNSVWNSAATVSILKPNGAKENWLLHHTDVYNEKGGGVDLCWSGRISSESSLILVRYVSLGIGQRAILLDQFCSSRNFTCSTQYHRVTKETFSLATMHIRWPNETDEFWEHCNNISHSEALGTQILFLYQAMTYPKTPQVLFFTFLDMTEKHWNVTLACAVRGAPSSSSAALPNHLRDFSYTFLPVIFPSNGITQPAIQTYSTPRSLHKRKRQVAFCTHVHTCFHLYRKPLKTNGFHFKPSLPLLINCRNCVFSSSGNGT